MERLCRDDAGLQRGWCPISATVKLVMRIPAPLPATHPDHRSLTCTTSLAVLMRALREVDLSHCPSTGRNAPRLMASLRQPRSQYSIYEPGSLSQYCVSDIGGAICDASIYDDGEEYR